MRLLRLLCILYAQPMEFGRFIRRFRLPPFEIGNSSATVSLLIRQHGRTKYEMKYCLTRIDCPSEPNSKKMPLSSPRKSGKMMAMVCYVSGQSMQDSSLRIPSTCGKFFRFLRFLQQTHFKNVCCQACGHVWARLKPAT